MIMSKPTPDELGALKITTDFVVSEDMQKGTTGDNILDENDWEIIMGALYNNGYEITRRD